MADSVSKTNIPVLRAPYGAEVPPKVPVCETNDVGSKINPVYVKDKVVKASDADLGSTVKPIYMNKGVMTECKELAPRDAPNLRHTKEAGSRTVDDVPTSTTPSAGDPDTMIATKKYVDDVGARATKVTVVQKTTAGAVIATITVDGTEVNIYNGGGGGGGGTISTICVPLLTPMWFDHQILDSGGTWVESESVDQSTSNMKTKSDYPKIYEHLSTEYAAVSATKTDTYTLDTGSTVTISYKETADGHKICTTSELSKLNQIFNDNTIGSAWYFVLDTTNLKFHLPRTKYGFNGKFSYVKRPQLKITGSGNSRIGEETMRLYFYTGVGPTSADKMDKVLAGVSSFTTTAPYGEVATFQANNGQVEASGHKIVNPSAPVDSALVTVDYLNAKIPKVTPSTESWTFEALDGSTTTKTVVTNVSVS